MFSKYARNDLAQEPCSSNSEWQPRSIHSYKPNEHTNGGTNCVLGKKLSIWGLWKLW
jgi:hypothetical protein